LVVVACSATAVAMELEMLLTFSMMVLMAERAWTAAVASVWMAWILRLMFSVTQKAVLRQADGLGVPHPFATLFRHALGVLLGLRIPLEGHEGATLKVISLIAGIAWDQ
jgi:hypothetical protein